MAEGTYSADEIVDKTLFTKKSLPYYDSVPSKYNTATVIGTIGAGLAAGQVYSYIDADPYENRDTLWWMFYPGGLSGNYYYMPHRQGDFDMAKLEAQGVLSEEQKRIAEADANKKWYEKLFDKALPAVVIAIVGAAAVRGYLSRKN